MGLQSHLLSFLDSLDPTCLLAGVGVQSMAREQNRVNTFTETEPVTLSSWAVPSNPLRSSQTHFWYAAVKFTLERQEFHTVRSDVIQRHLFQHDNIVLHLKMKFSGVTKIWMMVLKYFEWEIFYQSKGKCYAKGFAASTMQRHKYHILIDLT